MTEMLPERYKKKSTFVVPNDNPKRIQSYVKHDLSNEVTVKPNMYDGKKMRCIWQKNMLYYELLKLDETINGERLLQ